mgnify:CR=1 FL=1
MIAVALLSINQSKANAFMALSVESVSGRMEQQKVVPAQVTLRFATVQMDGEN